MGEDERASGDELALGGRAAQSSARRDPALKSAQIDDIDRGSGQRAGPGRAERIAVSVPGILEQFGAQGRPHATCHTGRLREIGFSPRQGLVRDHSDRILEA